MKLKNKMKIRRVIIVATLYILCGCASTFPHYDTFELHSVYLKSPAIDDNYLILTDRIRLRPGITRFTFPAGQYKPIEMTDDYIYFLSPYGTLVEPIGHPYFVKGGIKMNLVNGDLKFISFLGELSVGTQNIRDYKGRIMLSKTE